MKNNQLQEMWDINAQLIRQNMTLIPRDTEKWENESETAKINYAAGYNAALQFCNTQIIRIDNGQELHHLEDMKAQVQRNMSINQMKKESGEYILDEEYWADPY